MIIIKTEKEIEIMRQGGKILGKIREELKRQAKIGVTTKELDHLVENLIKESGGKPSFKMVPNYRYATCMCVNEMVVHGLPSDYKLKAGDILGVDIGLYYRGFHTDTAWTITVGPAANPEIKRFLITGELALGKAIKKVRGGNYVGDISQAIQETIEDAGFNVVRALVGHGIGRKLHEEPEIPCFLAQETKNTPLLKEGMTLAIEVIYNMGTREVVYKQSLRPDGLKARDRWTIVTKDGSLSGLFEHTVAVTKAGPKILT